MKRKDVEIKISREGDDYQITFNYLGKSRLDYVKITDKAYKALSEHFLLNKSKSNLEQELDAISGALSYRSVKSIDRVTTSILDAALRMCRISFDFKTVDKIIDLVELIEEKGKEVNIGDIEELKAEWDERDDYGN